MHTPNEPRPLVGLIGLGSMGTAMAERLLDAGYDLCVYNRTPEKAAAPGQRGAAVAEMAAGYADDDFMSLFVHLRSAPVASARVGTHPDQEVVR